MFQPVTANAERLSRAMRETGVTVWTLSRRTGIARSRISFYRNGSYPCTGQNIARIAKALGIPAGDLL